jgi:hypothetical protein
MFTAVCIETDTTPLVVSAGIAKQAQKVQPTATNANRFHIRKFFILFGFRAASR